MKQNITLILTLTALTGLAIWAACISRGNMEFGGERVYYSNRKGKQEIF